MFKEIESFNDRLENFKELINKTQISEIEKKINLTVDMILTTLNLNLPILICGNGGSASDALHISGELVGQFLKKRKPIDIICLNTNVSVMTAWSNDYDYESVFARQVAAHGKQDAILWGISTSGNSKNIVNAFIKAKELKMKTIGLTGLSGGKISNLSDILLSVPSKSTPRIQEIHILIYHQICEMIENKL